MRYLFLNRKDVPLSKLELSSIEPEAESTYA
jgi:hypothetical protein